ncbi:Uncharacterised protein [Candidatus Tiddalikarchaeum anstoanum]|nr:Uncharacterised protein [Candidatus Tiddalikarchaeum anstoanum]
MKIKIPKRIKVDKDKIRTALYIMLFAAISIGALYGILYLIQFLRYKTIYETRNAQCVEFTTYLNEEVLPQSTANVTDCSCHFENVNVGIADPMCLCSCKLYDQNGTLIDDDWNPMFSVR